MASLNGAGAAAGWMGRTDSVTADDACCRVRRARPGSHAGGSGQARVVDRGPRVAVPASCLAQRCADQRMYRRGSRPSGFQPVRSVTNRRTATDGAGRATSAPHGGSSFSASRPSWHLPSCRAAPRSHNRTSLGSTRCLSSHMREIHSSGTSAASPDTRRPRPRWIRARVRLAGAKGGGPDRTPRAARAIRPGAAVL